MKRNADDTSSQPPIAVANRVRRAGAMARMARTLTEHYFADREAAETGDGRDLVWRTYIVALMTEMHRRISMGEWWGELYQRPRRSRVDLTLPSITIGQHDWDPRGGPVAWTLWQRRSRDELLDLYLALKEARCKSDETDLDALAERLRLPIA